MRKASALQVFPPLRQLHGAVKAGSVWADRVCIEDQRGAGWKGEVGHRRPQRRSRQARRGLHPAISDGQPIKHDSRVEVVVLQLRLGLRVGALSRRPMPATFVPLTYVIVPVTRILPFG